MTGSAEMKLVFRLDGIGFSLSVNLLVEIVELDGKPKLSRKKDAPPWPQAEFRGEMIPVVDIAECVGIKGKPRAGAFTMLVLHGEIGLWGALVHTVEGIRPNGEFEERTLSPLFSLGGASLYDSVDIWREEPLIQLAPDRFAPQGGAE